MDQALNAARLWRQFLSENVLLMSDTNKPLHIRSALSGPESRLLLLIARPALSEHQQELAKTLSAKVEQWPVFIETALHKYVLPMVYQNLASLTEGVPADVLVFMRDLSIRSTAEMLQRHAAFNWFHEHCVLVSGVDYAYFKGHALAFRFYENPLLRFYRDVDILVPSGSRKDLMRSMLIKGCRVCLKTDLGIEEITLSTDAQLSDFLRVTPVPVVVTPQGLVVELHSQVDQQTSLFRTDELLRDYITVETQHHCIRVLPDAAHFSFICYHHTRHMWSKLNWLADLNVICADPKFDKSIALAYGRRLHIESTLVAALELNDLASSGFDPTISDHATPGKDLLRACVDNLVGDVELEKEMRKGQRMNVISFDWQSMPVSPQRRLVLMLRRLRPAYSDFRAVPGGQRLWRVRYFVASGKRLLGVALRQMKKIWQL